MGTITTGIGLISGIDTATLIDNLIALESRGKFALQRRLALLQARRTSLLDINARLLNLKSASSSFRLNNIFDSTLATSSNGDILRATATGAAQPGTFKFIVKQLVSSSQRLTKGFADRDTTPIGLTSLSFEFGNGRVSSNTDLSALNGGTGVARGKIEIEDSKGTTKVDLGTATTINDVLNKINNSGANVVASLEGDHLVITEKDVVPMQVEVRDIGSGTTAADLGIDKIDVDGDLVGDDIRTLGGVSALSSLNDGTGVLINSDTNPDLHIETREDHTGGVGVFDINLGRIDNPITFDVGGMPEPAPTLIEDLNDGAGVTLNSDSEADIKFVDRDGNEYEVDLTGIVDVQDLADRVSAQSGGVITITIHADGDKLTVNDSSLGTGLLKVEGAGVNGTQTAEDLGILEEAGVAADMFDGDILKNADHTPAARTIQDIIDRINNAVDNQAVPVANGTRIVASIDPTDGVSLLITDNTAGANNLVVTSTPTNAYAARDLGIDTGALGVPAATVEGNRLIAGLSSILVRSLNGGNGLNGNTTLDITDRDGAFFSFPLDEDWSLSEIIDLISDSTDVNVTASLNDSGNGLLITDDTGSTASNLIIAGNAAAELSIAADVAADSFRGSNLQTRYVSEATLLSDLNYGRGVGLGEFRITDGLGVQAIINIASDSTTLFDIIREINGQLLDVTARVNDNGDGLLIENDLGTGIIRVDSISGTTAADLNILGQAADDGDDIDGSYEKVVALNASDTLDEIISALNDAGIPVTASILNTGAGPTPFQLNFASDITGKRGDLVIDAGGFDLGLTTLSEAQDAEVFFGSDDPAKGILIRRSSNTLDDVLNGVTIDLVSADETTAVTVTITRDTQSIIDSVSAFVTAFNDAIGRIDQYDFFDVESEERGILLGNPTTGNVRRALFRLVNQRATGLDTPLEFLSQVGITVGGEGVLNFDQDRFTAAFDDDPEAVKNLFAAFKATTTTTREISEGITVSEFTQTFTQLGFGDLFDQLLDGLTNSIDGVVTVADGGFQDQIDLTNARIDRFDERLEAKRERLERQFVAMELALAQLQAQSGALLSLSGSLSSLLG